MLALPLYMGDFVEVANDDYLSIHVTGSAIIVRSRLKIYTYHKEHVTLHIIAYITLNEQVMYTMSSNSSAV